MSTTTILTTKDPIEATHVFFKAGKELIPEVSLEFINDQYEILSNSWGKSNVIYDTERKLKLKVQKTITYLANRKDFDYFIVNNCSKDKCIQLLVCYRREGRAYAKPIRLWKTNDYFHIYGDEALDASPKLKNQIEYIEKAKYHYSKKEWKRAIFNYKKALKVSFIPLGHESLEHYNANIKDWIAGCYVELKIYKKAAKYTEDALNEGNWSTYQRKSMERDLMSFKSKIKWWYFWKF